MEAILDKKLQGSKTEKNIYTAFAGETQANVKYTYYAQKARENGYNQIADIFEETAKNELAHAKIWFEYLKGGEVPSTVTNLNDAASGEHFEWAEMYAKMADDARSEGFDRLAFLFDSVAKIEKEHEERFSKLLENIKSGTVFSKEGEAVWVCQNCGYIYVGKSSPEACPVCTKPRAYFEVKSNNY